MSLLQCLPYLAAVTRDVLSRPTITLSALEPFPTTGLAHDHVGIAGTDLLLRVPRQSQMRLDAKRNLAYQAACFERMARSGHTPRLHAVIPPSADLPMGALIVDRIRGGVLKAPEQLPAAAEALAAIHALPVPQEEDRAPLMDQADPMVETLAEVLVQAKFLDAAALHPESRALIERALAEAKADCETLGRAPKTLISFDAHPGNFLVQEDGRAFLVDLEKGRYGGAGFDLAHATLYTSTTWDVATYSEPSHAEINGFYDAWRQAMPRAMAAELEPFLLPMRRLMWLWSITWCAKWRVESHKAVQEAKHVAADTEDWSKANTNATLIAHVADRVDHYLSPQIVARIQADWT